MSTDLHALTGAYAINALTPEECRQFRTHLDACAACQQEVREFEAVAALMGASEALPPPTHLKARVMAAADKQSQLPPRVTDIATAPKARWTPRILGAAASVILVVAAGIAVTQMQDEPDSLLAAGVTRVFEAPDARTLTVDTSNGGEVEVALSESLDEMAVDTDELPALTEAQVYQLWAIRDGTAESAGVLTDPDRGAAMDLPGEDVAIAITIEPSGGSEQPTTEPIVTMTPGEA